MHAGVDVTQKYIDAGVKFSWPIYKSGLQVMVADGVDVRTDFWAFTRAFDDTVWLAMGLTALGIAVFVWWVERHTYGADDEDTMGEGLADAGRYLQILEDLPGGMLSVV